MSFRWTSLRIHWYICRTPLYSWSRIEGHFQKRRSKKCFSGQQIGCAEAVSVSGGESVWERKKIDTYQIFYEILCKVEEYGAELNVELKRKLKRQCLLAPRFLREALEVFEGGKQVLMWNQENRRNREGYAGQLMSLARDDKKGQRENWMREYLQMIIWKSGSRVSCESPACGCCRWCFI